MHSVNWKLFKKYKEQLVTFFALLAISTVSFSAFGSGIVTSDDWSYVVAEYAFGTLHPIHLNDRRPLALSFYYFMASVFGLKLEYYYFANFLILIFSAYLVYAILKKVFPEFSWMASLIAIVYLIYPVDYSRTWFVMIYIRMVWLTGLLAVWLWLEFGTTSKWWIWGAAMAVTAIPLGAYEGQFGVIALTAVLIAFGMPKLPLKRRIAPIGGILLIGLSFLVWRFFIQEKFLNIRDAYVEAIQFSPELLISRYLDGLNIFTRGWLVPIQTQLRLTSFALPAFWLAWIILEYLLVKWIFSKWEGSDRFDPQQKVSKIKSLAKIFLLGGMFWVAGYIPIIALYPPSLSGHASRVNLFAIPGAAMMVVSAIAILSTLVTSSVLAKRLLVILIFLPFIAAGIFVQLQINYENQIAWEKQKQIWNGLFAAIPNIADEKHVVIIIPGYQHLRPFQPYPFLSGWGIEAGMEVLYNNRSIGANFYYKDVQPTKLLFTKNGFRPIPTDKVISYKKLIFAYYDPETETVRLVENLEETLGLGYSVNNYFPHENIVPAKHSTGEFRWLVK